VQVNIIQYPKREDSNETLAFPKSLDIGINGNLQNKKRKKKKKKKNPNQVLACR
jgi:hypothetical protein